MHSIMRRLSAGVIGVAAVASLATLVAAGPAGAATAAPARHSHSSWPTVKPGAKSERTYTVQYLLQGRGMRLVADGKYGAATTAAVRAFQRKSGLKADGVVGGATWDKLIATVKYGSRGSAVFALQHALRYAYGYKKLMVIGFYTADTRTYVQAFQRKYHLDADGVVGKKTWKVLVANEK
jgi:zinc D-Ala-D-Ala carboxypeptidase